MWNTCTRKYLTESDIDWALVLNISGVFSLLSEKLDLSGENWPLETDFISDLTKTITRLIGDVIIMKLLV